MLCTFIPDDFLEGSVCSEKLGQGTYGTVYRVITRQGTTYAIKYLPYNPEITNPGVNQSGLLDTDALVRLRNVPEIIHLIGICSNSTYLALILESMDCNLHEYLTKASLNERIAVLPKFVRTMIRTAALMETVGITHFDLKPQNILVRRTPEVIFKVTDFGLSRNFYGSYHVPNMDLFSLWYRPPEFIAGRPRHTFPTTSGDVWSIGMTALELAVGTNVISHNTERTVLRQIQAMAGDSRSSADFFRANQNGSITGRIDSEAFLKQRITLPNALDPRIYSILSAALILNPSERPSAISLLSLLNEQLDPDEVINLIPEPFPRRVDRDGLETIVWLGREFFVALSTTIIAIELFTRYLEHHPDTEELFIYALAAFRTASNYNEDTRPTTWQISSKALGVRVEEIVKAEVAILHRVRYEIYNMNLGPVIERAYQKKIDLSQYDLDRFGESLEFWFN